MGWRVSVSEHLVCRIQVVINVINKYDTHRRTLSTSLTIRSGGTLWREERKKMFTEINKNKRIPTRKF